MADITAAMVKDLREKSGAGMMDCKKALSETGGDMDAAMDWLRTKGLASAAKKSSRTAAEGLVGVASAPGKAAMVEVNAETDFVARNETFQEFVAKVAEIVLAVGDDLDAVNAAAFPDTGRSVAEELTHLVATIGENMTIRRAAVLSVKQGVVASYMHQALRPGLGKIGVLAAVEGAGELDALEALGRQVGMHVAATSPDALDVDSVDPAFAPGTGTPEVGGLASWQMQAVLRRLSGVRFVGMDVVEVAPAYDVAEITALAAATVAWEYLALLSRSEDPLPHG